MKFNKLIPELCVSDVEKSLNFYTKVLGFKIEYSRPEDKFYFLSYQGSQLMIEQVKEKWFPGKLTHPFGTGVNFQIETRNIKDLLSSLKKHKYPLLVQPRDRHFRKGKILMGFREFLIQDPDGYVLRFLQSSKIYPLLL